MPGTTYRCLRDVLFIGPQPDDRVAVRDLARPPLTFGRLRQHVAETVAGLNALGLRSNDRVAVAMPPGPELFVTFMSVASGFTFAPLNYHYSFEEFRRCLADLGAKALVVRSDSLSAAAQAAMSLGVLVIEVTPRPDLGAGLFSLPANEAGLVPAPSFGGPEDLAMVLFTAGTTAKPKMVPFSHARLCRSISLFAENNAHLYDPEACNICLMPMFHLQGIIFPISTLAVGVSVACTPAMSVPALVEYLREFRPRWFSGGPPILKGLLDYGGSDPSFSLSQATSHFVCSGARLSPQLARSFEARFGLPVVNSYWMSECLMISSNSPAKARARPGSVGTRGDSEIRFLGDDGKFVGPGQEGEIVVRGPQVITGYLDNPAEDATAFIDGWFCTGDTGYMDADGYLFVTGRVLERINKGGEKVSPGEIEEILLSHPAVSRTVVFPVQDPVMGEDVGAAVVLREGMAARPADLRKHIAGQAAYFKVPSRLWIVDSIPVQPTGKVRRIDMYRQLKDAGMLADRFPPDGFASPVTQEEQALAGIWAEVLGVERIDRNDSFFEIGGDSLKAASLIALVEDRLEVTLPLSVVITSPTLSEMASVMGSGLQHKQSQCIVTLQPHGIRPPLYCFPTVDGALFEYYLLARDLGADQPVYGFMSPGMDGAVKTPDTIEAVARLYIREIRDRQPHGPYHLFGYCAGGLIAYEIACQLSAEGETVGHLGIVDFSVPGEDLTSMVWSGYRFIMDNAGGAMLHLDHFRRADARGKLRAIARAPGFFVKKGMRAPGELVNDPALATQQAPVSRYPEWVERLPEPQRSVGRANIDALQRYAPKPYGGNLTVFQSSDQVKARKRGGRYEASYGWRKLVKGRVKRYIVPGDHGSVLNEGGSGVIAQIIRREMSG